MEDTIANWLTFFGVAVAAWQLHAANVQARTTFEDGLNREYRDVISLLPAEVMLNERLSSDDLKDLLDEFYRYFDLCNEQAWLARAGRVSDDTWKNWREGIESNFTLQAFQQAWETIGPKVQFDALRAEFASLRRGSADGASAPATRIDC